MSKGPNSFFVVPDSEMIIDGTIYSSDDPTGIYTTTCLSSSANSGSMSSFMVGTPSSNTTYQFKIQDSGSNGSGTFIQRLSTASGSDQTTIWYGEPDRRYMWDIHNPLLKNYSTYQGPGSAGRSALYWDSTLKNNNVKNIQGVYSSFLDKEFIYVAQYENMMPKLHVASRSIYNKEAAWTKEGVITTLMSYDMTPYNISKIDSNNRGLESASNPLYGVCEHIDNKIKLAVKFNEDVDIYESSDGVNFNLIAKNILSRFVHQRFIKDLKIASSGPYLKIAFVIEYTEETIGSNYVYTVKNSNWLGAIVSADGGATWSYTDPVPTLEQVDEWEKARDLSTQGALAGYELAIPGLLVERIWGSVSGATFNYDLCGLTDGSGRFILAASGNAVHDKYATVPTDIDLFTSTDDQAYMVGIKMGDQSSVNQPGFYTWYQIQNDNKKGDYVRFWTSTANSKFDIKTQMGVPNVGQAGKVYLACNNDWIWCMVAGSYNPVNCDWSFLNQDLYPDKPCGGYWAIQNNYFTGSRSLYSTRENSMFFLPINCDLNAEQWIPLGNNVETPNGIKPADPTVYPLIGEDSSLDPDEDGVGRAHPVIRRLNQKSGKTTGGLGSYFYYPEGGNFYACGPYMAFTAVCRGSIAESQIKVQEENNSWEKEENQIWEDVNPSESVVAQYYRFSGWLIRPPNLNQGMHPISDPELRLSSIKAFQHQPQSVLSAVEFNYIWGKPCGQGVEGNEINIGSFWSQRVEGISNSWDVLSEDGLHFQQTTTSAYACRFYYFRCPTVADSTTWSYGSGQAYNSVNASDVRYPMFPHTLEVNEVINTPQYSWFQEPRKYTSNKMPSGSCVQFVFGGVSGGSDARNSIGIKINSFVKGQEVPQGISSDVFVYEFFLRMDQTTLKLYNTSQAPVTDYYRETGATLVTSLTSSGGNDFSDSWWEGRLCFLPNYYSTGTKILVSIQVRQLGTETWIDSNTGVLNRNNTGQGYNSGTDGAKYLGFQGISFGLFPDSASTRLRDVSFRYLKVCQGSDMSFLRMRTSFGSSNEFPPEENLIRGRNLAPNPIYIGTGQEIAWGGIGGKFGDIFDSQVKSSYDAKNTIKTSSPRFEYRTKGDDTSDIKSSTAKVIYQIPNAGRTASSLPGYAFFHSGLGIINTNAGKIKIEYSDTEAFGSPYVIGTKDLSLKSGRISAATNNIITVTMNGESASLNANHSEYTSTDSGTYYCKFTALGGGGLPASLLEKSYKIIKTRGNKFFLNLNDRDFSDGSYSGIAGTSISVYSDRMISRYTTPPTQNKYMRVTLMCHLGTTDYFKMGSLVAGVTFGMQRVPIDWKHNVEINGNVTEFKSRSGIRWGYKEGPSVKTFTGDIQGDVFDDERRNIENIASQATQFNSYPVAWVFDGDTGSSFDVTGDDANAKAHINPANILYGTINNSLQMVNEGWRYDSDSAEWKVVGDLQLTIIEVV